MLWREGTNDWNTTTSCLTEDEYGLAPHAFSGYALDIGGYSGGVTIALLVDNPGLRVTVVEPVPANVDIIRRNLVLNGVADRATVVRQPAAGPDVTETLILFGWGSSHPAVHPQQIPNCFDCAQVHNAFVGNSTLFTGNTPNEHLELVLPTVSLTDLLEDTDPAVVKIDCEAGEWSFFDDPLVSRLPLIVGEWHAAGGTQAEFAALLGATHDVTFSGPVAGPGGFVAVRRKPRLFIGAGGLV